MNVMKKSLGFVEQKEVHEYTLVNDKGMTVTCLDYGCIITRILTPDRFGNMENVVLGYDHLEEYIPNPAYLGAIVGRVAGRIAGGSFELDGQHVELVKNHGNNHLHGGTKGISHRVWKADIMEEEEQVGIRFTYISPDGEEQYPGTVSLSVTYTVTNKNELIMTYDGLSDQKTLLNMTNHTYFNLSGNLKRDIKNHELKLNSEKFLELNEEFIPTGAFLDVEGTPFDFREFQPIGKGMDSTHLQIQLVGNGFDHPFLLNEGEDNAVELVEPQSGRTLSIETDQVGLVMYTGNFLPSASMRGVQCRPYLGVCFETQGLPDAIHHNHFPSIEVEAGVPYKAKTIVRFGVR
ncbi:aldose epimerase family protein [Metabacillus iocasae]|uniref:Aldose 1-epimerase n=1 Tax=Priestia iocasae TaxID=2291674 RepID=A0ABS2QVV9_9BACI|nr:aldose epimerase family protein [Metabacillus iocasae]MBM7703077.1 aldose 1-epimerase [Metabacillus iocasae]